MMSCRFFTVVMSGGLFAIALLLLLVLILTFKYDVHKYW